MRVPNNMGVQINKKHPKALGVSDRNGFIYLRKNLVKDMQYRGNELVWTGFWVGKDEADEPNRATTNPILKPDPVPVDNPRPGNGLYNAPNKQIPNSVEQSNRLGAYNWGFDAESKV